jgi:hypothetical protein
MQQDDPFDGSEATVEYASPVPHEFSSESGPVATAVNNDTNLERVRDILFGSQARTTDKRMQRLDERLVEEIGRLREEVARRMEQVEGVMKTEIDAINQRLKGEERKRASETSELGLELQKVSRGVARRFDEVDEELSLKERDLRQLIQDGLRQLNEESSRKMSEMAQRFQRESHEIRDEKADRATLAGFFKELATQLGNDGDGLN